MKRKFQLVDLPAIHPQLLWDSIIAAAAAVLESYSYRSRTGIHVSLANITGIDEQELHLFIETTGVARRDVARLERTYEPSRLVELAAIAIAGISIYHIGGHVISDIALRYSGADYLLDGSSCLLEVAGRTRRREANRAWHERWERLQSRADRGFYLFVVEFESFTARLGFGGQVKG